MPRKIYTIGHSIRKINSFIKILILNRIRCVVDVRSYPVSKFVPQFNKENLKRSLSKYDIKYVHILELGGRRHFPNLHHPSIQVTAFSSYAEYMMTEDFATGLKKLKKIATRCRTAVMCSEVLWWRCHRRMISDRLEYDGWEVYHLGLGKEKIRHQIWNISRLNKDNQIIYDG
jgi:uncharacterized protein (DUF488 family)